MCFTLISGNRRRNWNGRGAGQYLRGALQWYSAERMGQIGAGYAKDSRWLDGSFSKENNSIYQLGMIKQNVQL